MKKIKYTASSAGQTATKVSSAQAKTAECKATVAKVKSGLDMQISAKKGIDAALNSVVKNLEKEAEHLTKLSAKITSVSNEFQDKDRELARKMRELTFTMKMIRGMSDYESNRDKRFSVGILKIPAYKAIVYSIIAKEIAAGKDGELEIAKMKEVLNKISASDEKIVQDVKDQIAPSGFHISGDNFIVNGYEQAYRKKQPNGSSACGAVALANLLSIRDGKVYTKEDMVEKGYTKGESKGWYMNWPNKQLTTSRCETAKASQTKGLNAVKDALKKGKPCMLQMYNQNTNHSHYINVIGFPQNKSIDELTFDDLIIFDPADGKIHRLGDKSNYLVPPHSYSGGTLKFIVRTCV